MKLKEFSKSQHTCSECGGPSFTDLILAEKKDACYHKVKASAKVWPSAYASGRLVQCRKKGAANYGNKSEGVAEGELDEACWDTHRQVGMKKKGDRMVPDCRPRESKNVMENNRQIYNQVYQIMVRGAPEFMKQADSADVKRAIVKAMSFGDQISPQDLASYAYGMLKSNGIEEAANPAQQAAIAIAMKKAGKQPMNEYNAEYDDEAGMADNNLETLARAVEGIDDLIQSGDNLPEWCQEKISNAKSMLVAVWDYMYSEESSDEVDPDIDAMFEAMQDLVSEMAQKNRVSEDLVWETFEAMPDNVLYETAAWRRKEGKSAKGGLNRKGVASYRRENPGSKLQMAVTTKPSKLKPGSKAAKRRKSFCARMSGVKGPMKKPNGKPTRKALALRKWNC